MRVLAAFLSCAVAGAAAAADIRVLSAGAVEPGLVKVAEQFGKPLIATSDAHQLHAFGRHYTSIPRPGELMIENVFAALRNGPRRVVSPSASIVDLVSMIYFFFFTHPARIRARHSCASALESKSQT